MMRALMTKALFVLLILLSAQALAFDVDGLSYSVINPNNVQVDGCATDPCSSSDIVIPATVMDSGTTYSVTAIADLAFAHNALTSAAFEGDFGTFDLNMFSTNPALATITYCEGTTGWPQTFSGITATPISCVIDGDIDGDGVPDGDDNCPSDANTDQLDTDEDGVGDLCTAIGC